MMARIIEINIPPIDDETSQAVSISIEERRADYWSRRESRDVTSGTPGAQQKLLLGDTDRVVIEPHIVDDVIYDKEQMSARPMTNDEKQARLEAEGKAQALQPGEPMDEELRATQPQVSPVSPQTPAARESGVIEPKPVPPPSTPPKPSTSPATTGTQNKSQLDQNPGMTTTKDMRDSKK